MNQNQREKIRQVVKSLYKDEKGEPIILTDGQCDLFGLIFYKQHPRSQIETPTRWGKSFVEALAVLTRVCIYPETWGILSGSQSQAHIIMDYIIQHIFDNEWTQSLFVPDKTDQVENIKKYRNKSHITFALPGGRTSEIYVKHAKGAIGFGAPNVLHDEASLTSDADEALVMRMLGDQPDNYYFKIGNPFFRNHFLASHRDDKYHKFIVTVDQAIAEGRLTREYVEEMSQKPFFGILYGGKDGPEFPKSDTIDKKGYTQLISEGLLNLAYITQGLMPVGELRLGVDVAGGGKNYSTIVLRADNFAQLLFKESIDDTMVLGSKVVEYATLFKVPKDSRHIFLDKVGVGKGLCDRFKELMPMAADGTYNDFGINFGSAPEEGEAYINLRAQAYWRGSEWIARGGKILKNPAFDELLDIRYKHQSDKRVKIKSKDEMADDNVMSPDVADAFALTFSKKQAPVIRQFRQLDVPGGSYGLAN